MIESVYAFYHLIVLLTNNVKVHLSVVTEMWAHPSLLAFLAPFPITVSVAVIIPFLFLISYVTVRISNKMIIIKLLDNLIYLLEQLFLLDFLDFNRQHIIN